MRKQQNETQETGKMLAATAVSMNVLILAILIIGAWGVHSVLTNTNQLRDLASGFSLTQ